MGRGGQKNSTVGTVHPTLVPSSWRNTWPASFSFDGTSFWLGGGQFFLFTFVCELGTVVHAYNPSTRGGLSQEMSSRLGLDYTVRPYRKNKRFITKD
jgi:hypothetical protein